MISFVGSVADVQLRVAINPHAMHVQKILQIDGICIYSFGSVAYVQLRVALNPHDMCVQKILQIDEIFIYPYR